MYKWFQIGAFCFQLTYDDAVCIPEHFLQFQVKEPGDSEFVYRLRIMHSLPALVEKILLRRPDLTVYQTAAGEARLIGVKGQPAPYALYREVSGREAEIFLASDALDSLRFDPVFTSLFALERQMIRKDSLILHCAYIRYQGTAILFSAPSETGKSTQADLWETYRGSETVNGDRALLRNMDGVWHACGWPVCGTSEICHPSDTPIGSVVMLRQGKENHAERLSPMQAFAQIYSQITINQWNREFVGKAVELIEDLVTHVPVWQLTCDISEAAVQCLYDALFPAKAPGKAGTSHEI